MINTAVLVSGGGMNLQAIMDSYCFGEIPNCTLTAVISSVPDAYALTRAKMSNIPSYVVDYSVFPNSSSFSNAVLNKLKDLDIELVVLAGFAHPLEPLLIKKYQNRIINTWPALMPAFSGRQYNDVTVHAAVLESGAKISGATAYFVTEEPNRGPIILQKAVEIWEGDSPVTLQRRVMEEGEWRILPQALSLYCSGRLSVDGNRVRIAEENK